MASSWRGKATLGAACGLLLPSGSLAQQFFATSASGLQLTPQPWHWVGPDTPTDLEVVVNPDYRKQLIMGFGGAFTEASALQFESLQYSAQEQLLEMYFGGSGHMYTVGRVPINSCDFSPQSYTFDDVADDFNMYHFDKGLNHDRNAGMIDMIARAAWKVQNLGGQLKLFGSPWSPPSWMKDNNHPMVGSGEPCLKRDTRYHAAWAKYLSTWVSSYEAAGIDIYGITAQNEPAFYSNQQWEACSYTAEEQRDFIRDYLGPQFATDFGWGGKKIVMFDWNKPDLQHWSDVVLSDPNAAKYVWGIGLHWYSGDFFDQVGTVSFKYPDHVLLSTEGCNCEYDLGKYNSDWSRAARYAHDIIGDLNSGVVGWIDWNLLLDVESGSGAGGPNHGGNLCFAQVHVRHGQLQTTMSYFAFGQFSRFLPPGSVRLGYVATGIGGVEAVAFSRPDGQYSVVMLNNGYSPVRVGLRIMTQSKTAGKMSVTMPPQAIGSVVFPFPGAEAIPEVAV